MNLPRIGMIGVLMTVLLMLTALSAERIKTAIEGADYSAQFADVTGLQNGNAVRIAGIRVGKVTGIDLEGQHVRVDFVINGVELGSRTRAAIKTESGLGTKFLDLQPAGDGQLGNGATIPLERTTSLYDLPDVLDDVSALTGEIDVEQLGGALDTLTSTFADTPSEVQSSLEGVRRLSEAVASRDQALREVLGNADSVSAILAARNDDLVSILTGGNALLEELETRRETIRQLIVGVSAFADQLVGLVDDHRDTLRPTLRELRKSLKVLNKHVEGLDESIELVAGFGRSLMEAVGGGPFFYGFLVNLAPTALAPNLPDLFGPPSGGGR
jgi:phospholipid/cholesterol/gamma-HCH transport system substrate-binding protein